MSHYNDLILPLVNHRVDSANHKDLLVNTSGLTGCDISIDISSLGEPHVIVLCSFNRYDAGS